MAIQCKFLCGNLSHNPLHKNKLDNEFFGQHPHSELSRNEQLKIRIIQKNTVFIFGLPASICTEPILSSYQWFGKFGTIIKIITGNSIENDSRWANVTYSTANKTSSNRAINFINNEYVFDDGRVGKATYGYKRYCQFWLCTWTGCTNPKCDYLHSWCDMNALSDVMTDDMRKIFHSTPGGQRTTNNNYWDNKFGKTSRQLTQSLQTNINLNNTQTNRNMNEETQQQIITVQQQRINGLMLKLQRTQKSFMNETHLYNNLQVKYNSLKVNYFYLDDKYKSLKEKNKSLSSNKKDSYLTWNIQNVYDWITDSDNGYFQKYKQLRNNLENERIGGQCLSELDKTDLHRLGITNFSDKLILIDRIQALVAKSDTADLYVEGDTDTQ